jgi:phenylacetate-CoA ligase
LDDQWAKEIPRRSAAGIGWPATPDGPAATVMALAYQFEKSQFWPAEELLSAQLRQLGLLAAHTLKTVPFYRQRLEALAQIPVNDLTLADWQRIPILKRIEVQEAGEDMISTSLPANHGKPGNVTTSGSVGRPITLKNTAVTKLFQAAINLRYHHWHGRNFSAQVCCIRNLNPARAKSAQADKGIGWVPAFRSGPMFLFLINRPVSQQLDWLLDKNPDFLLTFPSNLAELLKLSWERGVKPEKLVHVATMSEVLDPALGETCQEVWNVPVVDAYSSEEAGLTALQCPGEPVYHVQAENLLVEILDEDGKPCGPGRRAGW